MSESEEMYVAALLTKIDALEKVVEHLEFIVKMSHPKEEA